MRKCVLYGQAPDLAILLIWFVIGLILAVIGVGSCIDMKIVM